MTTFFVCSGVIFVESESFSDSTAFVSIEKNDGNHFLRILFHVLAPLRLSQVSSVFIASVFFDFSAEGSSFAGAVEESASLPFL